MNITEEKALARLSALCARAEHSSGEVAEKLRRWGVDEATSARIVALLTKEGYVDDRRYCQAFVNDKIRYAGWGRRKIEQALYLKGVAADISREALDSVPDDDYLAILRPLLQQKWPTINARNDYERATKLINFAMGRGFDYSLIRQCIDSMPSLPDD